MARFDKGIRYYTHAQCDIFFPEDDVACKWCPLLGVEMASGRKYCKKTGEILVSDATIGYNCPLKFEEEDALGKLRDLQQPEPDPG